MKRLALLSLILCAWFHLAPAHAQFNGCYGFCGTSSSSVVDGPGFNNRQGSGGGSSLACTYTPVTTGTQNVAYTGATPSASGGVPAYTFSETGALPNGVTINTSTGVLSGTPTVNGSFPGIQVKVTDTFPTTVNCGASFTLVIAAPGPPVLTFVGTASGGRSGAVETYTSAAIGPATGFTTRRIICSLVNTNITQSISSVTIGGITATVHVQSSTNAFAAIFSADVPTGTTATIAVTFNSNIFFDPGIAIYSVDDALMVSTTPTTGTGAASAATAVSTSAFNQSTGGFAIGASALSANPASGYAITGYTTDQFGGAANQIQSHLTPTGSGSTTAAATWATLLNAVIVAASWR